MYDLEAGPFRDLPQSGGACVLSCKQLIALRIELDPAWQTALVLKLGEPHAYIPPRPAMTHVA